MSTPLAHRRRFHGFSSAAARLAIVLATLASFAAPLAAAEPDPAAAADARLIAIGALSATSMVSTQAFLGVVADGLVEGLYKKAEEVEPDLDKVVFTLEGGAKAVEQVRKQKLTDSDQKFLDDIRQVFALQTEQAKALVAYAKSKDQAELKRWQTARVESQKRIDALLGTGDEELVVFENAKEKLNASLAAKFVSFRVQYPPSWKADVATGKDDGAAFLQITSSAEENGKNFLLEQCIIAPLSLKAAATAENETALLKEKVADLAGQLAKKHPQLKKTSEGALKVAKYKGYGFEFTDLRKNEGEDDTEVYGRIVLIPPSATKQATGLMITLLATNDAEEIDAQGDLGTKGELPLVLQTFEIGSKAAAKEAPKETPKK